MVREEENPIGPTVLLLLCPGAAKAFREHLFLST
jgi:hypothetical protein